MKLADERTIGVWVPLPTAGMEREDLGLRRTGARAFDYNKLRAHVDLKR